MEISKFGPWYTMTKPDARQGLIADETTGATIAVSYDAQHAELIAAAPDLLEACKRIAETVDGLDMSAELWDDLHTAIAKAEGRQ